jgi:ADP-ribose pyrophosphatase YjhB (NUDIX family)
VALPGGHLEWGENIKECLEREIVEELGVKPEIGRLLYVNNFVEDDTQSIEFFFEVINSDKYINLENLERTHAHELTEIYWVKPADDMKILPQKFNEDFKLGKIISNEVRYI